MGIFSIIPVEVSNSLLSGMLLLNPIFNEILNLSNIHELHIVNMSILLSFDDNVWRYTFVAHGFWIRLMILASCVNFVPDLRRRKTIVAFNIRRMDSLAFKLFLLEIIVERNVSDIGNKLFIKTVDTFCVRSMLA